MDKYSVAEITIRPMTKDDADAIAELWLALVAYHQVLDPALPAAAPGGQHRYVRRLIDRIDDPYTCALVAEEDGHVMGFVLGMVVDLMQDIFAQEMGGFLADIYVEPEYRKRGVGKALVNTLRQWFRQRNIHSFEWHVAAHNPDGIAFWRAVGGREVMIRMRADV
jgi:ribosomal protein S18 acetylase RimI-like enzyme